MQAFGLDGAVTQAAGKFEDGRSELAFSPLERLSGPPNLNLRPGAWTYLMLAWSHKTDFQHHSARR